ncbi:MAG: class I SAM-dependent methyltransferase [Verrucomicrobiales bacterium]|nr:class I SAM-dependent methyltransferase [Verrucomicrobiales bacterium]
MMKLDEAQRAAQLQFGKQSAQYGKGHILADVADVAAALDDIALKAGARALDVATGAGHTALYLAGRGFCVTACDVAAAMLDRTAEAAAERGLQIDLQQHVAEVFPYADESFDLVTCRVAGHHFSDPAAFVKEAARVLKAGGWFLLIDGSVPNDEPVAEAWTHQVEKLRDPSHGRFLRQGEWSDLCEQADLVVKSSELQPMKMPDLDWYFEAANTSEENRVKVRELVKQAPAEARRVFQLVERDGKVIWWWQRLTLVAAKEG